MLLNVRLLLGKVWRTLSPAMWLHVHYRSSGDSAHHSHSGVETNRGFTQHVPPLLWNQWKESLTHRTLPLSNACCKMVPRICPWIFICWLIKNQQMHG